MKFSVQSCTSPIAGFCQLDLEGEVPHHSTFSVNRLVRFRESNKLRHIFEREHSWRTWRMPYH